MRDEARALEGVPVTIKDLQHTKGIRTDFGTHTLAGSVPDVDVPCATRLFGRLRHAGQDNLLRRMGVERREPGAGLWHQQQSVEAGL